MLILEHGTIAGSEAIHSFNLLRDTFFFANNKTKKMSVSLSEIVEARAKLMAAMPDIANAIEAVSMPSAEQLKSLNSVLSKDSITKRPRTEAQAYRRSQLNRLKQQKDISAYKEAMHQALMAHYHEQMTSGGLTKIDGGNLAKRANYQSSGVDEIEAIISRACNECPTL